jgi:hypothetical protein
MHRPIIFNLVFGLSFLQSWLKDASNTFQGLDGPVSTAYAGLTASLLAAGLGYIFAPGLTLAGVGFDPPICSV